MLLSFCLSVRNMPFPPDDYETDTVQRIYMMTRVAIDKRFGPRDYPNLLPKDIWTVKDIDDWLFEIQNRVIPVRAIFGGGHQEVVCDEQIVLTSSPGLRLAWQLGYAHMESRIEMRRVGSNLAIFRNFLLKEDPFQFTYDVVIDSSIPPWLLKLVTSYYLEDNEQYRDEVSLDEDPFNLIVEVE